MEYSYLYDIGDFTNSVNIAYQTAWTKTQQRKKLDGPVCSIHPKSNYINAQCRQQNGESTNDNGDSGRKKGNITPWKPANAAIAQDQQDLSSDTDFAQTNIVIAFSEYHYTPSSLSQLHYRPVVIYCIVYHYTKRATLARLLANEGPAIYVVL